MSVCAHCNAVGLPLVLLAGGVRVCHACFHRQHDAGVVMCSQCLRPTNRRADSLNVSGPPLTVPGKHERPICLDCYRHVNPNTVINAQPHLQGITPQVVIYDEAHDYCTCTLSGKCDTCLDAEYPPVTEDELDYVRRSLGAR